MKVSYQIGADVFLKYSRPEISELALMSGTSRTYISRIENDKSDIEIGTLRKIIETGLGKTLDLSIK